jgi:hypothetical protein
MPGNSRKPRKAVTNPLLLMVGKQKVGQEDADKIAMPLMIHLDAAKRGQCTDAGCNTLAEHLIAASLIAAATRSKAFHDQVTQAYVMLKKAAERPTKLLDLTTGEYMAIREAIATYVRALPNVEIRVMRGAMDEAVKRLHGASEAAKT